MPRRRLRVRVDGIVQGVGFRPYVYRLAAELGLAGYVLNDERGVLLEVEGGAEAVERFLARLPAEAPPLATVERVHDEDVAAHGDDSRFRIVSSERAGEPLALVSPDTATCRDCLSELFDPADRRYRYPFINCTNCGPRFTIVRGVPYDRPQTTMAGFGMRALPGRIRGPRRPAFSRAAERMPRLRSFRPSRRRRRARSRRWRRRAARRRRRPAGGGGIVAVKGLGGFHLACVAADEAAAAGLRARKHREDKPFALMVRDIDAANTLVELTLGEQRLLVGRERPIVVARRRLDAPVAAAVAPGLRELGVMLPYSPLHHLLLADTGATLVMTSGNVSDEPIAYRDDEALERLAGIADALLVHDRPIHMRTDDSVVRAVGGRQPVLLRRSRGYVPASVDLPLAAPRPVLACGAELKNTFCVARGERAWVGHHIGDLQNFETLRSFTEGIAHFQQLFAVEPEVVAHDLHPDYLSTRYALEREEVAHIGVQHHHAHLAACLAEHGEVGPAVGAIFDGTGYGTDGTVWGGELLVGDLAGFVRAGHLRAVPMPGGEQAIRQPWRMACAWLAEDTEGAPAMPPTLEGRIDPRAWRAVAELCRIGMAAPRTTSIGRLFDAVAALCGLRTHVSYEGQAAVELEAACEPHESGSYPLPLNEEIVLDAGETVRAVARDVAAGTPPGIIAARFHRAVATATAQACATLAGRHDTELAVLSGGVFQNRRLLEDTAAAVERAGLRLLVPERLPPNDGGIAYGQAAVAAALRPGSTDFTAALPSRVEDRFAGG